MCHPRSGRRPPWLVLRSAPLKPQQRRPDPTLWFPEGCVHEGRHGEELLDCWGSFRCPGGTNVPWVPVKLLFLWPLRFQQTIFLRSLSKVILRWCNSRWLSCSCVTVRCGEWFVWVVIDLGVFVLFKWSNYWFCLLLGLCKISPHILQIPRTQSILASIFQLMSYIYLVDSYLDL